MAVSPTVAVVDYGMGNLRSVAQAVHAAARELPHEVVITQRPEEVMAAERVVLPGQGAMPDCMRELKDSGLLPAVLHAAAHKPLFGVCVGMQVLLSHSEEGNTTCLNLIAGEVRKFDCAGQMAPDGNRYKVPQMGWNRVHQTNESQSQPHALWNGIADESWYYFVHSFYAAPADASHVAGVSHYGQNFAAAIAKGNVFATQFHPEKSAAQGLALYRNFLLWKP